MQIPYENIFTARTWFQLKCQDPNNGNRWLKARILCTFGRGTSTALHLFDVNMAQLGGGNLVRPVWLPQVHGAIRTLLDCIVTRWRSTYLLPNCRTSMHALHRSLTPDPLFDISQVFDESENGFDFDIQAAQVRYEQCFVPLLYDELWDAIKKDTNSMTPAELFGVDTHLQIRITSYELQQIKEPNEYGVRHLTTLVHGSYTFEFALSFDQTLPKLGLYDIVLINIVSQPKCTGYFAVVVHVVDRWPPGMEEDSLEMLMGSSKKVGILKVDSDIVLYTSRKCTNEIGRLPRTISLVKLSNITSSRRQISAIYNLPSWSKQKSLLKPMNADFYFHLDPIEDYYEHETAEFNRAQNRVIDYAERIFDSEVDRMHLVHGPPGTGKSKTIAGIVCRLVRKLNPPDKILVCAPSNTACDELLRRILDVRVYRRGRVVRVGCKAPLDHRLCEHFLDSLTMQELVTTMQRGRRVTHENACNVKERLLTEAKVIVSTLNYSVSAQLQLIKLQKQIKFVIIDEACQSIEADCLLPLYFRCAKIILVGDPKQLTPCVLSTAGQEHNLSQSLYTRLDSRIHRQSISLLTEQYRMHEEICAFPSTHFYDNLLETHISVHHHWPDYPLEPYYLYNLTYTQHTIQPNGGSSCNIAERDFIRGFCIKLLEHLVRREPYNESDAEFIAMENRIVVITPYQKQMKKFRDSRIRFPRHIEVMTADSAQGKEKDIVLISCVRSGGTIGFLADEHRLNVMLTRARRALYIFGNFDDLAEQNEHWRALVDDAEERGLIDLVQNANYAPVLPTL